MERLLSQYGEFFKSKQLGKDLFLTFRVPNPRVESGYRLGRAFMVILSAQHFAHSINYPSPLFEVILPMTESSKEIFQTRQSFKRIAKAARLSFNNKERSISDLEIIPIFESVKAIINSTEILKKYVSLCVKSYSEKPSYLRPFVARSDPALNSGIVPTTLAIKWALSEYAKFSNNTGIPTYPIIAPGALPFRGHLTPNSVIQFAREFRGVKTVVIQSAFRYDYPTEDVKKSIEILSKIIPEKNTDILNDEIIFDILQIIPWFEKPYKKTVEKIAPIINRIAAFVPKRRERVQHIGLFGYSRQIGKTKLPRAIGFCASCYSLGLPPELFGMGKGLAKAKKEGKLEVVESLYKNLKPSLLSAGRYLRKESIKELGFKDLGEEIKVIEDYLGEELGPQTREEKEHLEVSGKIISALKSNKNISKLIEQAAILRHSLG